MFHERGFGHRGDDCTFETLQKEFRIRDRRVKVISEIIHDADLADQKFGRKEVMESMKSSRAGHDKEFPTTNCWIADAVD